ncbi:MAG: hypothetical protein MJ223_02525 [Mycoplasmoidaceae bacterium]|nr:hypothetical protein [Mycoplasmoidaceae bacterium]
MHRDTEHKKKHPTKVGNLYFFLEKVGYKYDYIFENDSSSIVTSSFVENCMCYFKTPLWQHDKDGGIISNGSFYGVKNLISFLNSKSLQFSESIACGGGANQLLGGPVMSNG